MTDNYARLTQDREEPYEDGVGDIGSQTLRDAMITFRKTYRSMFIPHVLKGTETARGLLDDAYAAYVHSRIEGRNHEEALQLAHSITGERLRLNDHAKEIQALLPLAERCNKTRVYLHAFEEKGCPNAARDLTNRFITLLGEEALIA